MLKESESISDKMWLVDFDLEYTVPYFVVFAYFKDKILAIKAIKPLGFCAFHLSDLFE
jgi:hypothetical protein